mmetsp:Transcript_9578/g.24516  ORF Transcript_9578/g.24516 Transcript_9578/m.24516 type:complete len:205 (-) Transcript_9578:201-815(-)
MTKVCQTVSSISILKKLSTPIWKRMHRARRRMHNRFSTQIHIFCNSAPRPPRSFRSESPGHLLRSSADPSGFLESRGTRHAPPSPRSPALDAGVVVWPPPVATGNSIWGAARRWPWHPPSSTAMARSMARLSVSRCPGCCPAPPASRSRAACGGQPPCSPQRSSRGRRSTGRPRRSARCAPPGPAPSAAPPPRRGCPAGWPSRQ